MKKLNFQSIVYKEGSRYISQCLDVDIASSGKTKKEALKHLHEALELYFEDMPFPKKQSIKNPEIVSIALQHA